jgi:hypothetical protein
MTTARAEAATSPAEDILVPCRDQQQQGGDADADVVVAASSGFTTTPPTYLWFFFSFNWIEFAALSTNFQICLVSFASNDSFRFILWETDCVSNVTQVVENNV